MGRARLEKDGLAFVAARVEGFDRDDSAWLLLLQDLDLSGPRDEPDDGTFARGYSVEVGPDEVVIALSPRLPRQLEATWAALAQPWCVAPHLRVGSVALRVHGLAPAEQTRLATALTVRAEAARAGLERDGAALRETAAPDGLPCLEAALAAALKRVDAIASQKRARLAASSRS